jgi:predicted nucleic acid-binding protein
MKNTALLIDTNVVLDWILKREPFHTNAKAIMELCLNRKARGYLACHTILNLFFLLRKERSIEERKELLLMLCNEFDIIGIDQKMLVKVLCCDNFKDLEDDIQMQCAAEMELDYIITKDIKGFKDSKIKAISPEDFLAQWQ